HILCRLGGERGAQTAGAEEHKLLILAELLFVVGALRIDPEFQHPARHIERTGDLAVAFALARIAQIDEHHVIVAMQFDGVGSLDFLNLALGGLNHRLHAFDDLLRHSWPPFDRRFAPAGAGRLTQLLPHLRPVLPPCAERLRSVSRRAKCGACGGAACGPTLIAKAAFSRAGTGWGMRGKTGLSRSRPAKPQRAGEGRRPRLWFLSSGGRGTRPPSAMFLWLLVARIW